MSITLNNNEQQICKHIKSIIPEKMAKHFESVEKPWDINEVIVKNLEKIGYKDVVQVYELNEDFGTYEYKYYFYLKTFMEAIEYTNYRHVHERLLKGRKIWTGEELQDKNRPVPETAQVLKIPESLNISQFKQLKFIDIPTALYALSAQQSKGKSLDKIVELLYVTGTVSKYVTEKLIQSLSKLQLEQKEEELQKEKDLRLKAEAKDEYAHEMLRKSRIRKPTIEKKHSLYLFESPDIKYRGKIGITDNLERRLKEHQTSCPTGNFTYSDFVYNSGKIEKQIHEMFKDCNLKFEYNSSAKEWVWYRNQCDILSLLKKIVDNRNDEYEHAININSTVVDMFPKEDNLIEENPQDKLKRIAKLVIENLIDNNFSNEKHITKKSIQEQINVTNERVKIDDIIEIEIEINNIVYQIEKTIPSDKKREKIYIRIKQ